MMAHLHTAMLVGIIAWLALCFLVDATEAHYRRQGRAELGQYVSLPEHLQDFLTAPVPFGVGFLYGFCIARGWIRGAVFWRRLLDHYQETPQ